MLMVTTAFFPSTSVFIISTSNSGKISTLSTADASQTFALRLYYADTNEEYGVGFYSADGEKQESDWPVKVGQRYYFKIICDSPLNMPLSIKGSGKITNITA